MPSRSMRVAASVVALATAVAACSFTTSLDGYTCSPDTCADAAPDVATSTDAPAADTNVPPQPDTDGLGDGHMGDKHVIAQEVVNTYAPLANDAAAGATTLDLAVESTLAVGDLLLVWQTMSEENGLTGTSIALAPLRAGTYELVRAKAVSTNVARSEVTLATPLAHAYAARGAQAVRVAEYTNLVVERTGKLIASAWNGRGGGIVAVLTRGGVRVDGAIVADALGGRGGVSFVNSGGFNCGSDDGVVTEGYAARGEGIAPGRYAAGDPSSMPGGRANAATGGGGGVCHNSGAGGGGNGSAGGQGGHDYDGNGVGRDVGGLGGSAVTFLAKERLVLGGGGGAGDRHDPTDTTGGNGGGVIFVRAHDLDVSGSLRADGVTPAKTTPHDGAGGGGAGGTIALTITGSASCTQFISARGGAGGSTTMSNVGPGGGGGGGHIALSAAKKTCMIVVTSGSAGTQANAASAFGKPYGAKPETATEGVIEP